MVEMTLTLEDMNQALTREVSLAWHSVTIITVMLCIWLMISSFFQFFLLKDRRRGLADMISLLLTGLVYLVMKIQGGV